MSLHCFCRGSACLAVTLMLCGCSSEMTQMPLAERGEPSVSHGPADRDAAAKSMTPDEAGDAVPANGMWRTLERPHKKARQEAAPPARGAAAEVGERSRKRDAPDAQLQSGTLTAGTFDDHQRYDDYRQFVSKVLQSDSHESFPRLAFGRRVTIQVCDRQGQPVGDARIVVHPDTQPVSTRGDAPLEVTSGSDGRAVVLTGIDGLAGETCHLTVYPPGGDSPVSLQRRINQGEWTIRLDDAQAQPPTQLDLALIIDTTGSMSDELEYLKVEIAAIAQSVREMFPGVDQRYSLIVYRDRGDQYVTRAVDFTRSIDEFRRKLGQQSAAGGGDYPEAMHVALQQATQLSWRENSTARVAFLLGDAPPHDQHASSALTAVKQLRRQGVRLFPVAASGVGTKAEFMMRASAFLTLGQYLFLTDHSGIGNSHAKPHLPDYQVERLDRAMIRMIASELAGRRLVPSEVLALERGELNDSAPRQATPPNEPQQTARAVSASRVLPSLAASLAKVVHPSWMMLAALMVGVLICDVIAGRGA